MTSYSEKLRDPRWQRKRLEILNRADFACERCGATTKTLNVHHKRYRSGAAPWEYADHELESLCDDCHDAEHGRAAPQSSPRQELWRGPVFQAVALLVQYPGAALSVNRADIDEITGIDDACVPLLVDLLVHHLEGRLYSPAERWDDDSINGAVFRLALTTQLLVNESTAAAELQSIVRGLVARDPGRRLDELIALAKGTSLNNSERLELQSLLHAKGSRQ